MGSKKIEKKKKLIVLVEDEELLVSLLKHKLERAGYEVKAALEGAAGLELIRESKPDLVLLDILLPKMNGYEVMEALNKEGILPGQKLIVISNSGRPAEVERIMKLGASDYLIKVNFDPSELMVKIKAVLGENEEKVV